MAHLTSFGRSDPLCRVSRSPIWPVLFSLGLTVVLAAPGAAQIVRGSVIEDRTGNPVEGASVRLLDADSQEVATAVTGDEGRFLLTTREPGVHALEAQHIAYATVRTTFFEIPGDGAVEVEVRLDRTAIPLEPLTVIGRRRGVQHEATIDGFYARRANLRRHAVGPARALGREDRVFREAVDPMDLLNLFPPIAWEWRGGNCEAPAVFWNGRLVDKELMEHYLRLSTAHLEGLEYYRSLDALPLAFREEPFSPEFVRKCGVVALWSRRSP